MTSAVIMGFGTFSGIVQGAAGVGVAPAVAMALARSGAVKRQREILLAL